MSLKKAFFIEEKREKVFLIILALILIIVAEPPHASGDTNSFNHNFGTESNERLLGREKSGSCSSCHTPHKNNESDGPQWEKVGSHKIFVLYSNSSIDSVVRQPGYASLLCLSCHDGSIAGNQVQKSLSRGKGTDVDLSDDHPISVIYDSNLASKDSSLRDPTFIPSALPLFSGKIECSTCHNVHQNGASANKGLLRINNSRSRLCLACHIK